MILLFAALIFIYVQAACTVIIFFGLVNYKFVFGKNKTKEERQLATYSLGRVKLAMHKH